MNLTAFGSAVRKARIDAKVTLQSMSKALGVSAAYLSGMEVGRKNVSEEWVAKIQSFFINKGVELPDLQQLADISNQSIPLKGMSHQQMMMVSGFARASLTDDQVKRFVRLLEEQEA
ncbi:MAG: helix-turn-helix domain-containing protein [Pigmentiphaga sp.]|nr:helix-turn-helix domain-containing protein [Pigmentiphaga sp.]